jgi:hypothetical protein
VFNTPPQERRFYELKVQLYSFVLAKPIGFISSPELYVYMEGEASRIEEVPKNKENH